MDRPTDPIRAMIPSSRVEERRRTYAADEYVYLVRTAYIYVNGL